MVQKQKQLTACSALIDYVTKLGVYQEQVWLTPLGSDKWSIKEVIGHLIRWDHYFYETTIHPIVTNSPITMSEDDDVSTFNTSAAAWALSQSKEDLIHALTSSRKAITDALQSIPEEHYSKVYADAEGNTFTLAQFIQDIASHDQHHTAQITQAIDKA
ncbi:DinB family protein [Paenibacillus sp. NPDC058174]|uniref:DinB family protein n=1 Tax=Paenibacillus sp. NPDC058174 TaxID=3346366 RepID=UPI0036DE40B2